MPLVLPTHGLWQQFLLNFLFCWPCNSIHLCNKNQLAALFILSLFRQSTSTCFGHICSPSSGGILYIYNSWYVLYIYSTPPDDGLQICPKHIKAGWRNKLKINTASSWFSLHEQFLPLLASQGKPQFRRRTHQANDNMSEDRHTTATAQWKQHHILGPGI